ncbi:MAG TPA: response regulator [Nitrospinota bacterium]|jgi:two-component system capsular synthesis sensor histidine kinase RcsC|nr:response regulator [Nitrospinota bacterium]|tara:strand:+ start:181 stop:591 length:411 start_codon:yes stop_codon:yes gene_type:complete
MKFFEPAVIIVDDSPLQRKVLASQIQKITDWKVIEVEDPVECLNILKGKNIPLVITDVNMPKMDGLELLQEILSLKKGVQVVVMSTGTTVSNCVSCFRHGATDFLPKPVVKSDLQNVFNNVLARLERWEKLISLGH